MKFLALTISIFLISSATQGMDQLTFTTQDFGPFHMDSPAGVRGPVVDIVNKACDEQAINCRIQLFPWRRTLQLAQDGAVNGLFVVGRNPERESWLYFSGPIVATEYGFFVPLSDQKNYQRLEDFANFRVGVYGPSNTSRALSQIAQSLGSLTLEMAADDLDGFRKLNANRIQAVYSNKSVGIYTSSQLALTNVRYAYSDRKLLYYIGFVKSSTPKQLVNRFNEALASMYLRGELQDILLRQGLTPAKPSSVTEILYGQTGK
ncbi:hypothetical protein BTA51_08410 [Hahella sp. CCB-MM4]|uniref:substrate-binding periplasmic protein n=1 Tax=Hahella sp. (strain CCB-MM4) TaxID=1926491 RepID=UPI000B9B957E|nr:transporter substrate-binding domain-containing protein [Hahella sp. CCB-MM4]OZG73819.1 hypothetical protein BTA51_08410 [Hahella sp. CCB-MM4]